MDLNEFRSFISDSGIDVWTWIDMAISVASADHEIELRNRRDGIVQKLFAPPCENCVKKNETNQQNHDVKGGKNVTAVEDDDDNDHGDEQRKILEIKNLLDDHTQVFCVCFFDFGNCSVSCFVISSSNLKFGFFFNWKFVEWGIFDWPAPDAIGHEYYF